jgi:ABC-type Fe3+ transport system permease subunit
MDADRSGKQDWENVVGWIAACILVILLLPILGMLYVDVLQTRNEAQEQVQKVEKLRRQIEQKEREKEK